MEGVGSRMGRASARYGPTQTVFNGPVRKWKKKWVQVSSSSSSVSQSNGHNKSSSSNNNGSPLLLCRWTPLSSNASDKGGALADEPPKRRFRYTPIAVLEERKKAVEEKDEDEASETNVFTDWSSPKSNEQNIDKALTKETQGSDTSNLDLGLCLKGHGGDHDSDSQSKDDKLMKPAFGDLF